MSKNKNKYFLGGLTILVLAAGFFWIYFKKPFSDNGKKTKYIAYIGRYTPPKDAKVKIPKYDLLHEVTLKSYINSINIPGTKFELKPFSCRNDGRVSDSIYQQIDEVLSLPFGGRLREEFLKLVDYQHHPAIRAPVAV